MSFSVAANLVTCADCPFGNVVKGTRVCARDRISCDHHAAANCCPARRFGRRGTLTWPIGSANPRHVLPKVDGAAYLVGTVAADAGWSSVDLGAEHQVFAVVWVGGPVTVQGSNDAAFAAVTVLGALAGSGTLVVTTGQPFRYVRYVGVGVGTAYGEAVI